VALNNHTIDYLLIDEKELSNAFDRGSLAKLSLVHILTCLTTTENKVPLEWEEDEPTTPNEM
jgi:hypothetical protein